MINLSPKATPLRPTTLKTNVGIGFHQRSHSCSKVYLLCFLSSSQSLSPLVCVWGFCPLVPKSVSSVFVVVFCPLALKSISSVFCPLAPKFIPSVFCPLVPKGISAVFCPLVHCFLFCLVCVCVCVCARACVCALVLKSISAVFCPLVTKPTSCFVLCALVPKSFLFFVLLS